MKDKIGVVILNYSTYSESIELVRQLQNQTFADRLQIVIVDNFSQNDSFEKMKPLKKMYSNVVDVIKTEKNEGYARGNNFGLKYLEENVNPEYVAILNNDVILPHDCFQKLVERYKVLNKAALIAPIMIDKDGNRVILNKVNTYLQDISSMFFILSKLTGGGNKIVKELDNTGSKAMKVEIVPGSFLFTTFSVFKEIGYFFPGTFLYTEERFLAYAVRKNNLYNYILLDLTFIHNHSTTISSFHNIVSRKKLFYDGVCLFTRKYRRYGLIKEFFLKPLIWISLKEWQIIGFIKSVTNK